MSILNAINSVIWGLLAVFVLLATFVWHTQLLHKVLTPSAAFTSMLLFNMLKTPLIHLPWIVSQGIAAYTSLIRIHEFLSLPEVDGLSSKAGSSVSRGSAPIDIVSSHSIFHS